MSFIKIAPSWNTINESFLNTWGQSGFRFECWSKMFLMTWVIELTPYQSPGYLSMLCPPSSVILWILKCLSGMSRNKSRTSSIFMLNCFLKEESSLTSALASIIYWHLIMQPQPQSDVRNFCSIGVLPI